MNEAPDELSLACAFITAPEDGDWGDGSFSHKIADTAQAARFMNESGREVRFFRVRDGDIWGTIQAARLPLLDHIIESVHGAVDLLPPGSAGRARVEETRDYFTFIREDARGLDERWRAWRGSRNS